MTATAHALIGASLAVKITNPLLGIPLAIFSHYVADLIPHWDEGTNHRTKGITRVRLEAALDVLIGFSLVYLLFANHVESIYLYSMVIAAQLPDWLEAPSAWFNVKIPPFSWMDWLGHKLQSRLQLPWGLVTQIVVVVIILILTLNFSNFSETLASSSILNFRF